jgi:glycosyltransferase involved in cell wall biosynthesis
VGNQMKKTICLNMIVQNDRATIQPCLESVKNWIDFWVIVDMGSTDGTRQFIREFMKDVPGQLYERTPVNGAQDRNEALKLAKNKADYLLLIKPDQCLICEEGFVRPSLMADVYFAQVRSHSEASYEKFLILSSLDWVWSGALYETLICPAIQTSETLSNISISSLVISKPSRSVDQYMAEAEELKKMVQDDPANFRNVYFLALTYLMAEKYELALENYEKRAAMGGDPEEVFAALLAIGSIQEKLQMKPEQFISSYNKAFLYRPTRAEPLFCMARYYISNKSYFLGYLLSQYALTIPYPTDRGPVGFSIYDFNLLLQFAECSHALERVEDTCSAYRKLIVKFEEYLTKRSCFDQMKQYINSFLPGIRQFVEENQSKKNPPQTF